MLLALILAFSQQDVPLPEPTWSFGMMGSCIGLSGIVPISVNGQPELFCGGTTEFAGRNDYWYSLRRDPGTGTWSQSFLSPLLPSKIMQMDAGLMLPGAGTSLVLLRADGVLELHDPGSRALIWSFPTSAGIPSSMALADMDNDGYEEILVVDSTQVVVYSATGTVLGTAPAGGLDVVAAQMDHDVQLEIAVSTGVVFDGLTFAAQWTWPAGFGVELAAEDIDHDGRAELVAMEDYFFVRAYDVELQTIAWSIPTQDNDSIRLVDLEDDGSWDLILGAGQSGDISCFDAQTTVLEWVVSNPSSGAADVLAVDIDGNGDKELIWAAGCNTTGPDYLYIADWQTRQIVWRSEDLNGPFIGPEIGDLDGDGRPECVTVSFASEAGYDSGRMLVFDATTFELEAVSPPVVGGRAHYGVHDLLLYDVDQDGRDEIVIGAGEHSDGVIEIYDYSAGAFTLQWTNPMPYPRGATFHSVAISDVDQDGDLEVVGGVGRISTGALGVFVYVFDYDTRAEEWHSGQMGGYSDAVTEVSVADTDLDGKPEILGMVEGGDVYVYDGVSKQLEQIIPGAFTTMTLLPVGSNVYVLLGGAAGDVTARRWSGGAYSVFYQQSLAAVPVDGITPAQAGYAFIGAGGRIWLANLAASTVVWRSMNYGAGFGTQVSLLPGAGMRFLSAGRFSLVAFRR